MRRLREIHRIQCIKGYAGYQEVSHERKQKEDAQKKKAPAKQQKQPPPKLQLLTPYSPNCKNHFALTRKQHSDTNEFNPLMAILQKKLCRCYINTSLRGFRMQNQKAADISKKQKHISKHQTF